MSRRRIAAAAVALCVGGVLLPGSAAAAPALPVAVPVGLPAAVPPVEPCATALLPLGEDAADPDAPLEDLPPATGSVQGDPLAARGLLVADGAPAPPPVPATAWLVADLDSGEVLASCNARTPLATASTLKVLTALALLPPEDPATVHTAGPASAQVGGSRVGLVEGSQYTVEDLAHGLMLGSGNDAAVALGELVGGEDAALARMNALADRLGAADTVARTTSGLDAPGQVSTAHDLAVLARAALAEPRVAGPAATRRYVFPAAGRVGQTGRETYEIQTTSRLLRNYPGTTGLKSGFTRAAGGSYIGTAERDGRRYAVTMLRAQGRTWHHARDLLDWAWVAGAHLEAGAGVGSLAEGPRPAVDASQPVPDPPAPLASRPGDRTEVSRQRDDDGGGEAVTASPTVPSSTGAEPTGGPVVTDDRAGSLQPPPAVPDAVAWVLLALALMGGGVALRAARGLRARRASPPVRGTSAHPGPSV